MNKSFFFLRLPIAMSLLGHGLVRLPKLAEFSNGMVQGMEKSILPSTLVAGWGYILPFIEVTLGLGLLLGFTTKETLFASLVLMSILILGSSSIENWGAIESQLVHSVYLGFLVWYMERNG